MARSGVYDIHKGCSQVARSGVYDRHVTVFVYTYHDRGRGAGGGGGVVRWVGGEGKGLVVR